MRESKHNICDKIELEQVYAVVSIPTTTCELTLHAKVFLSDGELHEVEAVMDFDEVRNAIKEAEEAGYIPDDAVFCLTEKGRAYAEELARKEIDDAD